MYASLTSTGGCKGWIPLTEGENDLDIENCIPHSKTIGTHDASYCVLFYTAYVLKYIVDVQKYHSSVLSMCSGNVIFIFINKKIYFGQMWSIINMSWYDSHQHTCRHWALKTVNVYVLILHTQWTHLFKLFCFKHAQWAFPVSCSFEIQQGLS